MSSKGLGRSVIFLLCSLGMLLTTTARAQQTHPPLGADVPKPLQTCFVNAGNYYHIAPRLLVAIARTESRLNPRAFNHDRNGTVDVGLMQINSSWFGTLKQEGVSPRALRNPCMSIWIGARILSKKIDQFGNTWRSVGVYNAGAAPETRKQRAEYIARVAAHLSRGKEEAALEKAEYLAPLPVGLQAMNND